MKPDNIPTEAYRLLSKTFSSIFPELQNELNIPKIGKRPSRRISKNLNGAKVAKVGNLEKVLQELFSENPNVHSIRIEYFDVCKEYKIHFSVPNPEFQNFANLERDWLNKRAGQIEIEKKNEKIRRRNYNCVESARKNYPDYFSAACNAVSSGKQSQLLEIIRDKLKEHLVLIELNISSK